MGTNTSSDDISTGRHLSIKNGAASTTVRAAAFLGLALFGLATSGKGQETQPGTVAAATQQDTSDKEGRVDKQERLSFEWLPFPDNTKFKVLGLHWFAENSPRLWRMPKGRFDSLPKGVQNRCKAPAGGRIVMRCNTTKLGLRIMPLSKGGLKGYDVYINGRFFRSAVAEEPGAELSLVLFKALDHTEKEIVIYLPYHQEVMIASVGVDKDTKFNLPEHKYAKSLPVVFYGSSVCQGSSASKPGMTYEAIVCRELNLDFINLGFGGAGKAEKTVVDLVNSIPACCYVFDLGKSYGMQDKTAYKDMLQSVRKSHPDVPIICITPITSALEVHSEEYSRKSVHTRSVMRDAVNDLIKAGDKKVHLIEGTDLLGFEEHDGLSKDGVHPSNDGFSSIARKLLPVVKKTLGL